MKKCTGCRRELQETEYGKRPDGHNGLSAMCRRCENERIAEWRNTNRTRYNEISRKSAYKTKHHRPMAENKYCALYLGIVVSERVLAATFKHVTRMQINHPGYDLICDKNKKIDVKSACRKPLKGHKNKRWSFRIARNTQADYFLLLAFGDNRETLMPIHLWMVPGHVINMKVSMAITDSIESIKTWKTYEKSLDNVLTCCNAMKEHKLEE